MGDHIRGLLRGLLRGILGCLLDSWQGGLLGGSGGLCNWVNKGG